MIPDAPVPRARRPYAARMPVRTVLVASLLASSVLLVAPPAIAGGAIVRNPGDPAYEVQLRAGRTGRVWTGTQTVTFTNLEAAPLTDLWIRLWSNGVNGCDAQAIDATLTAGGTQEGGLAQDCTAMHVTLDEPVAQGGTARSRWTCGSSVPPKQRPVRVPRRPHATWAPRCPPSRSTTTTDGTWTRSSTSARASTRSWASYAVTLDVPRGSTRRPPASPWIRPRRRHAASRPTRRRTCATSSGPPATSRGRSPPTADGTKVRTWYLPSQTSAGGTRAVHSPPPSRRWRLSPTPSDRSRTPRWTWCCRRSPRSAAWSIRRSSSRTPTAPRWRTSSAISIWYGIVGDDQFNEPWLDESFATWSQFLPFEPWVGCRMFDWPSGTARLTNDMAYWNAHPNEYWIVYDQGGCMLANLAKRFGLSRFRRDPAQLRGGPPPGDRAHRGVPGRDRVGGGHRSPGLRRGGLLGSLACDPRLKHRALASARGLESAHRPVRPVAPRRRSSVSISRFAAELGKVPHVRGVFAARAADRGSRGRVRSATRPAP